MMIIARVKVSITRVKVSIKVRSKIKMEGKQDVVTISTSVSFHVLHGCN